MAEKGAGLRSRTDTAAFRAGYRAAVMGFGLSAMTNIWSGPERAEWKEGWSAGCSAMSRFDGGCDKVA